MRKRSVLIGLGLLLSIFAVAQQEEEVPRVEVFAGYSYMRVAPTNQVNAFNSNGGVGQFQYNINGNLGFVADLGGYANGNISIRGSENIPQNQTQFAFLFGPRFMVNKTGKVSPFVEFEVGGVHNSRSFDFPTALIPPGFVAPRGLTVEPGNNGVTKFRSTQTAFGLVVGGGIDVKLTKLIALRPIQLDYFPTKFSPFNVPTALFPGVRNETQWQNNLRYLGGVTFRFGGVPE